MMRVGLKLGDGSRLALDGVTFGEAADRSIIGRPKDGSRRVAIPRANVVAQYLLVDERGVRCPRQHSAFLGHADAAGRPGKGNGRATRRGRFGRVPNRPEGGRGGALRPATTSPLSPSHTNGESGSIPPRETTAEVAR